MKYNENPPNDPVHKDFLDTMLDEYLSLLISQVMLDALIDRLLQQENSPALQARINDALNEAGYVKCEKDNIRFIFKNHGFDYT